MRVVIAAAAMLALGLAGADPGGTRDRVGVGSPSPVAVDRDHQVSIDEAISALGQTTSPPTLRAATQPTTTERCLGSLVTVRGTPGPDRVLGTDRRDVVMTGGGRDVVVGLGKHDLVCTGAGDDIVRSQQRPWASVDLGPGDDRLAVRGAERALGGPGDDRMAVGHAGDVDAGAGDDVVRAVTAWAFDGGSGDDEFVVERGDGTWMGGPGDDWLEVRRPRSTGPYSGAGGCLSYAPSSRRIRANLEVGLVEGHGRDRVVGISCVVATRFDDRVVGTSGSDVITALAGDDVVETGDGDDQVDGGYGADSISLGAGDDTATGADGPDRLYGSDGSDYLEGWGGGDYLDGGPDNDQLYAGIVCAVGGNSYDTVGRWDVFGNEVFGGDGNDYLVGDGGNDRIDGGDGFDQGHGGFLDRREDWIESLEREIDDCLSYEESLALFGAPQ